MRAQTAARAPDLVGPTEACLWPTLAGADVTALAASFTAEIAPDASPGSTTPADEFFDRMLECVSDVASPPEVTPTPAPEPVPTHPETESAEEFISVSAGGWGHHTCGVTTDGTVACWGNDGYGQSTPPSGEFASVSAGGYHTCGVKTDGSVECWGGDVYCESKLRDCR